MTRTPQGSKNETGNDNSKIFIIGGGIANFTDVAATFKGLIKAITASVEKLKEQNVQIWIR